MYTSRACKCSAPALNKGTGLSFCDEARHHQACKVQRKVHLHLATLWVRKQDSLWLFVACIPPSKLLGLFERLLLRAELRYTRQHRNRRYYLKQIYVVGCRQRAGFCPSPCLALKVQDYIKWGLMGDQDGLRSRCPSGFGVSWSPRVSPSELAQYDVRTRGSPSTMRKTGFDVSLEVLQHPKYSRDGASSWVYWRSQHHLFSKFPMSLPKGAWPP